MSFYGSELGDRLITDENYPDSINEFLVEEKVLLLSLMSNHDIAIEVGCMEGRHCETVLDSGVHYIGVDISEEYIRKAKEKTIKSNGKHELLCIDAEKLDDISHISSLFSKCQRPLFFFPFNSIGNMENVEKVLLRVSKIRNATFLIFTYPVDTETTKIRFEYYNNCSYTNLRKIVADNEVRFVSADGLNSTAYNPRYISELCKKLPVSETHYNFCPMGIVYIIKTS